jgi:methyl coenzyme M reductase subunit C
VDMIFTNRKEMVIECRMMAGLGKSDHITLLGTVSFIC